MRPPFGFESRPSLLRAVLVPDPVSPDQWREAINGWDRAIREESLLECLVRTRVLTTDQLLSILLDESGSTRLYPFRPEEADERPEAAILRSAGFVPLKSGEVRLPVTGGPDFPPDLHRHIGDRARHWKWVPVHPLRPVEKPVAPGATPAIPGEAGRGTLEGWVQELISGIVLRKSPDIHFERFGETLHIKVKGPSGLEPVFQRTGPGATELLRIIKNWAGFSGADNPLPQDGRIELRNESQTLSFRASHVSTIEGESLVLRNTRAGSPLPSPSELGIPAALEACVLDTIRSDPGLVVATGTTGSGKTTTVCSLLSGLSWDAGKVLSIEDPVEYTLPNATQSPVNEAVGWTFPAALRAYLRQDPDIILLGEIRDPESATIALRAGLTGHSVLSTLHGRDPWSALDRFLNWGCEAGILAEALRVLLHQRLARESPEAPLRAAFSWLQPGPEELYACLRSGERPASMINRSCGPRGPVPASPVPRP